MDRGKDAAERATRPSSPPSNRMLFIQIVLSFIHILN